MSCGCENKRMASEYERMRRLAKGLAVMEGVTVVLYKNDDGTFYFAKVSEEISKKIVEYITPY